eukprot:scaffold89984_cov53-Attheya_sp.AAC.1
MVFDPSSPEIDQRSFKDCEWKNFYGDVKEAIPTNAPTARGKEVDVHLFCDSDHAGWNGNVSWSTIQIAYDGSTNFRSDIYLWR